MNFIKLERNGNCSWCDNYGPLYRASFAQPDEMICSYCIEEWEDDKAIAEEEAKEA